MRSFIAGCLMLMVTLVTGATAALAKPQTYYALVFNGPAPGKEVEYNRWYDEQHAPDVVSIPGFVSAQRYRRNDTQIRPNAGDSPPYLVVYKIVTSDLAGVYREVNRRAGNGQTRMSDTMARGGGMNITYRVTATHNWPRKVNPASSYLHIVLADPKPGENAKLDDWYARHHAPDMLTVPGFKGYALGTFSPVQMIPDPAGQQHMALFAVDASDFPQLVAGFVKVVPGLTPGPAMKNLWGYTYRPIGPELSGDRIRAERKRGKH